jgi:acyl-homoserine lactone acylase PvdQ
MLKLLGQDWAERIVPFMEENMFTTLTTTISDDELKESKKYLKNNHKFNEDLSFLLNSEEIFEITTKSKISEALPSFYSFPEKSNAWVLSGKYTKTSKPLLGNDPHLKNKAPSTWYLCSLTVISDAYNNTLTATGASIPGLPFILLGKTPAFSFGATALIGNNNDLYLMKLNSQNTHYLHEDSWIPLNITTHEIKVKGTQSIIFNVSKSHHGPIFHDLPNQVAHLNLYAIFFFIFWFLCFFCGFCF